ncbi:FAD-binding oxidoreductase [Streptomyces sp. NPDC038707]|uniref:FAD-binding oxidoreductase n=1 Tax=Streptomyces sp. NPDC038707 TaxID=3154329 RepID=UPI0034024490
MAFSTAHSALAALREDLAGEVFAPWDPGYDAARVLFDARADPRPAVIARCAGTADVVRAVRFGRELDLRIAVRGGGHGTAGAAAADGALVVDLGRMRRVTVDPVAGAARVEGGATTRDLDRAALPYGLATTGARARGTGVAGHVLGGGTGWLDRLCGPAVDNLLGVELVTAGAERVRASADERPELFWALHGGGGNFGVVTALTLRLRELPEFSLAVLRYPPGLGPEVVRAFRETFRTGPDELGGAVLYLAGPSAPAGGPRCAAVLTYAGRADRLRDLAGPLRALPHEAGPTGEVPYPAAQSLLDLPPGLRHHGSARCLTALPEEAAAAFCAGGQGLPAATRSRQLLFPQGGAVAAGPAGYPVAWRDAPWAAHPWAVWTDPADDERAVRWVRDACAALEPWSTGAGCLNLIGDEGPERIRAGLGAGNMLRLEKVKRRYDPDNVFRRNHNIRPV